MKKTLTYALWLIFLCPLVYLTVTWNGLPDRLPMHFNINGEPDRWGSKFELLGLVFFLVALNIGVFYLVTNTDKLDSRNKYAQQNKPGIYKVGFAVSIFLTVIIVFVIYSVTKGAEGLTAKGDFVFSAVGLLYCVIGNYMYSIKPNNVAGIRIASTLKNEDNWKKTHRMAGKLWFWGGLLTAVLCAFLPSKMAFIAFMCVTVLLTAFPVVYSLKLDVKKINRTTT